MSDLLLHSDQNLFFGKMVSWSSLSIFEESMFPSPQMTPVANKYKYILSMNQRRDLIGLGGRYEIRIGGSLRKHEMGHILIKRIIIKNNNKN